MPPTVEDVVHVVHLPERVRIDNLRASGDEPLCLPPVYAALVRDRQRV